MNSSLIRAIRRTVAVAVTSAVVTSLPVPAFAEATAATAPPAGKVTVEVITVNGSGCPAGTATVVESPDNTSFQVTFSNYVAWVGPGARPTDFRKNCQLNVLIHVPQGFTYSIAKAEYNGFARLARGTTGLQRANYYFAGSSQNSFVSHLFSGPFSDSWQTIDVKDEASLVWAPCGASRNLNINTELRVRAGTSDPWETSFMAMHTADGSIRTVFHYSWKHCY